MIYTVTFSPAIDYIVYMDELIPGETNRSTGEKYYYGGKGINVSTILSNLGIENVALGFVSGFTGAELENGLAANGLNTDFIHLKEGITRINIKLKKKEDDAPSAMEETEINCQGAAVSPEAVEELMNKLDGLSEGDTLVVSGNIPNTMPDDMYERILGKLQGRGVMFVVDATGDLLRKVLKYKPFLIKPNRREIEELCGRRASNNEEIAECARMLQQEGAQNVLVSMGGDGALLLTADGDVYYRGSMGDNIRNTVGSGDSMVAGFIAGYFKTKDYQSALKMGVSAGSASACQDGLATGEQIIEFYQNN
ncbi:MAG: 1-phosphofructokinase [Eubacteriaceae bacterium]|jgi:1-phosphofructokinase|nr:1-phosphofructokinase [Eubacteriaceae bacterium]